MLSQLLKNCAGHNLFQLESKPKPLFIFTGNMTFLDSFLNYYFCRDKHSLNLKLPANDTFTLHQNTDNGKYPLTTLFKIKVTLRLIVGYIFKLTFNCPFHANLLIDYFVGCFSFHK